jgi:hypothetical protein
MKGYIVPTLKCKFINLLPITDIDKIPFEKEESRETLRRLDKDLGGLSVWYFPPSEYQKRDLGDLRIGIVSKGNHSFLPESYGNADGKTPDEALEKILKWVKKDCVEDGCLLVVNPHSCTDRRTYRVSDDGQGGFILARANSLLDSSPAPVLKKEL